jgi:hypothetical protein
MNNGAGSLFTLEEIEGDIYDVEYDLRTELENKTKIVASKLRIKWLELGERSTKYFMNINKAFQNKSYFKSFIIDDSEVFTTKEKLSEVQKFYSELYKFKKCEDPTVYLDSIDCKTFPEDQINLCSPLNHQELTSIIKKCGDTAAGPDGIGYKLLKACWGTYSSVLIDSWNYVLSTGILAPSHRESVICLLEKKNKDKRIVQNLRPISLSNCDIKIITKALTKRFNNVLPGVINGHQAAYIPNRQVHDNLRTIDIIKDLSQKYNINGFLISLDARKAFDSVDHYFITQVLKKFGVCEDVIDIFKLLYKNLTARVLLNGFFTEPFEIQRSVKQGDALSCVLFIMCMDMVINKLNNNLSVKALRFPDNNAPKVLAYADDIAVVTNDDDDSLKSCLETYESFSRVSGLYLNIEKTEIIQLNRPHGRIIKFTLNDVN